MDKATRNCIERATQQARKLLEEDFSSQLEGTFDVLRSGVIASNGGAHLSAHQKSQRDKIIAAIEHKRAAGMTALEAVTDYVRDAAFTTLNRFVALKMLEARELVQECITKGEQSTGYREFCGMAPGVALLPDVAGYRLYIESLFDEFSTEIKVLFDRRDAASALWPRRQTFDHLLSLLNASELAHVWDEDETIGWVYQFFNSGEERKKMREESQAPRNSRELAVRNQFFTPRYVVQFLTDNTLGRLWLEMQGEKTRISTICEYLVRSADEPVQRRERKDPRDLRILDPACGSGHFLLYSFDLFLAIYEEAWTVEGAAPTSEATGRTLREDYPDLIDLRNAAPRLIVEQNLYGVDIDPRCAQIAALALWLRAQRAWKDLSVASSERPRIHRTHIVVAEPIPGEAALVDEFAARLDPPLLRDLFKKMVGESLLAGELGTLLRVEDGIADELHRAREQFVKQRMTTDFLPGMEPAARQGALDLSGIDDDSFFHEAEARIVEALRSFAETAIGSASVRRRLFAGDAAQGVALIDLVRTRFDVVLMNPPFGAGSLAARKEFEKVYPRTQNNIYAAFVERGIELLQPRGLLGAITSRTGFFLSSFQQWREAILLKEAPPVVFADLGFGVLDGAMVEVAAYCLEKSRKVTSSVKTTFLRALEADDKMAVLHAAIHEHDAVLGKLRFEQDLSTFSALPRSPFVYWVSDGVRRLFKQLPPFTATGRTARQGLATSDDFRFARTWWELSSTTLAVKWFPFAKGGAFSRFYADIHLVVNWQLNGSEIKSEVFRKYPNVSDVHWVVKNSDFYFRPGVTWSRRPHLRGSFHFLPSECIFGSDGPVAFSRDIRALSAILNSSTFLSLLGLLMARGTMGGQTLKYETGYVTSVPIPTLTEETERQLSAWASRAWSLSRYLDSGNESSHAFILPSLLQVEGNTLVMRAHAWAKHLRTTEAERFSVQAEIDALCLDLYGIEEDDRRAIVDGFNIGPNESGNPDESDIEADVDHEDDIGIVSDLASLAAALVSWAVGVAVGRFDVRLAAGGRPPPPQPDPFDPLPVCSPAMLTGDDRMPLASAPAGYPIGFPENGILVDDPGHARDITAAVRAVFEEVFDSSAEMWWGETASSLDPKYRDLRVWLSTSFFEHHLKHHSKSRRKAPVVWQLAVPSGRYSVWLYAHRLTRDSFFQIQNDVVGPKLTHAERHLTSLRQSAGANPTAKERIELAAEEAFVEELRTMLDEVKRVAPLWNPSLDDGVLLTMAPLWRLVPQHKPLQKELKSKLDELAAGNYDWAHIAMHLWPERVVPKCATDRSLAIAHGLEDVFWEEGADGKWKPRSSPTRQMEELVRERSSSAVKAALKSLVEAVEPNVGSKLGRRKKRVL